MQNDASSEKPSVRFIAYVYPGWHPDPYRPGVDEWDLLKNFQPYFEGHTPPPRPIEGPYDDAQPTTAIAQVQLAASAGIEAFMYFTYYSGHGFVMSAPMTAASKAIDHVEDDFAIAGTWCVRLPHDQFPVPARDELESPGVPNHPPSGLLEDTPIELLTLRDLETLLGNNDPIWAGIAFNLDAIGMAKCPAPGGADGSDDLGKLKK
jgi:hypothetical protein